MKGGLLIPGVTEIVGTSAAGKTQICMQLSLSVQLPTEQGGLGGGMLVGREGGLGGGILVGREGGRYVGWMGGIWRAGTQTCFGLSSTCIVFCIQKAFTHAADAQIFCALSVC